jgi:hypothetical protein
VIAVTICSVPQDHKQRAEGKILCEQTIVFEGYFLILEQVFKVRQKQEILINSISFPRNPKH